MPRKLSITDWLLIAFTLMFTISAIGTIITIQYFGSGYLISAHKLNYKPENYFVLNNPDDYILEAIAHNHSSVFKSLDQTQYDALQAEGFNNVEYQGSYYKLGLASVDSFAFFIPLMLTGFSFVGLVIVGSLRYHRLLKEKTTAKAKTFSS